MESVGVFVDNFKKLLNKHLSCRWFENPSFPADDTVWQVWWRHQLEMETFSALLTLCAVPGEFPAQRPVTRSFDVFFDLRLNKRLNKQSWGWWFETPSRSIWCHCNDTIPTVTWHTVRDNTGLMQAVAICVVSHSRRHLIPNTNYAACTEPSPLSTSSAHLRPQ